MEFSSTLVDVYKRQILVGIFSFASEIGPYTKCVLIVVITIFERIAVIALSNNTELIADPEIKPEAHRSLYIKIVKILQCTTDPLSLIHIYGARSPLSSLVVFFE